MQSPARADSTWYCGASAKNCQSVPAVKIPSILGPVAHDPTESPSRTTPLAATSPALDSQSIGCPPASGSSPPPSLPPPPPSSSPPHAAASASTSQRRERMTRNSTARRDHGGCDLDQPAASAMDACGCTTSSSFTPG